MTRASKLCVGLGLAFLLVFVAVPSKTLGQSTPQNCDLSVDCPTGQRLSPDCTFPDVCILAGAGSGQVWNCGSMGPSCTFTSMLGSCFGTCLVSGNACLVKVGACK